MHRAQNCVINGRTADCGRRTCKHECASGVPRRPFPIDCERTVYNRTNLEEYGMVSPYKWSTMFCKYLQLNLILIIL